MESPNDIIPDRDEFLYGLFQKSIQLQLLLCVDADRNPLIQNLQT
jgi:hypothetical protein